MVTGLGLLEQRAVGAAGAEPRGVPGALAPVAALRAAHGGLRRAAPRGHRGLGLRGGRPGAGGGAGALACVYRKMNACVDEVL